MEVQQVSKYLYGHTCRNHGKVRNMETLNPNGNLSPKHAMYRHRYFKSFGKGSRGLWQPLELKSFFRLHLALGGVQEPIGMCGRNVGFFTDDFVGLEVRAPDPN